MQRDSSYRIYAWKNTNRLLDRGFIGIKTGITDSAGPCLASAYRLKHLDGTVKVPSPLYGRHT
jgi:D-alanyl-D-alanine carboxypeptidase